MPAEESNVLATFVRKSLTQPFLDVGHTEDSSRWTKRRRHNHEKSAHQLPEADSTIHHDSINRSRQSAIDHDMNSVSSHSMTSSPSRPSAAVSNNSEPVAESSSDASLRTDWPQRATSENSCAVSITAPEHPLSHQNICRSFPGPISGSLPKNREIMLLALLLHYFPKPEGKIDLAALQAIGAKRRAWNSSGEHIGISACDRGVDAVFLSFLSKKTDLEDHLRHLASLEFVSFDSGAVKLERILDQWPAVPENRPYLQSQVALMLCYCFAGCAYTKDFRAIGRLVLPYIQQVSWIDILTDKSIRDSPTMTNFILEGLVGASLFGGTEWKVSAIEVINKIDQSDIDSVLRARIAERVSIIMKNSEDPATLIQTIEQSLETLHSQSREANAWRGLLLGAKGRLFYQKKAFDTSLEVIKTWSIDSPASTHELCVLRKITTLQGLIELNRQDYDKAIKLFQFSKEVCTLPDLAYWDIRSYLMCAYCEANKPHEALRVIMQDGRIELPNCSTKPWDRSLRNIRAAYADTLVCLGRAEQAEEVIHDLRESFSKAQHIIIQDLHRHFRVLLIDARKHHLFTQDWRVTLAKWKEAEQFGRDHELIPYNDPDAAIIQLSMKDAWNRMNKLPTANKELTISLAQQSRNQHSWIRGLRSYWLDQLKLFNPLEHDHQLEDSVSPLQGGGCR